MAHVRLLETSALSGVALASVRALLDDAFEGDFTDDDWAHACGGWHALVGSDDAVVSHAAIVPRDLEIGGRTCRAGYVEAVATLPRLQRTGLGSAAMTTIADVIRQRFELGVLSTSEWHFYERLGWARWRGPSFVRRADGTLDRTADDDDGLMALGRPGERPTDLTQSIVCPDRAGDPW